MTHYWYNDRVDTNNNHEVHKLSCKYLPDTIHSTYLGKFDYNFQAMEYARQTEPYKQFDGCYFYMPTEHNG